MTTHWSHYASHWQQLGPPLRPQAAVIECVNSLIGPSDARCLLLGATVEYAERRPGIVAMDATLPMLAAIWRGSDPSRAAIQADWTRMPVGPHTFSHVLCDGSLNAVPTSQLSVVLRELQRILVPDGTLIARVFCRPEDAESMAMIERDVLARAVGSFHALKWRVAMSAICSPASPDIAVPAIREAMNKQFPDREALCRATGWSRAEVDTIDVYEGSSAVYNFSTETAIAALLKKHFVTVEIIRCGSYALAERCPLFVARSPLQAGE